MLKIKNNKINDNHSLNFIKTKAPIIKNLVIYKVVKEEISKK